MTPLTVLVATTTHAGCGIAEHSKLLQEYVERADPGIAVQRSAVALDPRDVPRDLARPPLLHLNYHAALHSRWTPEAVRAAQAAGMPVVITYHDTGVPNSQQCLDLYATGAPFVVHEPCEDLPTAHYWRQGVPEWDGTEAFPHQAARRRPILGTCGHDFPWKNFPLMCEIAASVGWGMLIYTPEMSDAREAELHALNPWLEVRHAAETQEIIGGLHQCAANAFLYTCANTGTSAAIRWGIAAKKPVLAFSACRQMRDLYLHPQARHAIDWCETVDDVRAHLRFHLRLGTWHLPMVALAEQDSWRHLGRKYADLYRLAAGVPR